MKKCLLILIVAFLLSLNFLWFDVSFADDMVWEEIAKREKIVTDLGRNATIVGVIAISVAIIGAIVTSLQAFGKKWVKIATAILGIVVIALIAVKDGHYQESRRSLRHKECIGKKEITHIKFMIKKEPNIDILKILEHLKKIDDLTEPIEITSEKNTHLRIISSAFAQEVDKKPTWLSNPSQESPNYFSFIGEGSDADINIAETNAYDNAIHKIITHYITELTEKGYKLDNVDKDIKAKLYSSIKNTVNKSGFYVETKNGICTYHVLLRLNKKTEETALKYYSNVIQDSSSNNFLKSTEDQNVKKEVDEILYEGTKEESKAALEHAVEKKIQAEKKAQELEQKEVPPQQVKTEIKKKIESDMQKELKETVTETVDKEFPKEKE